MRYEYLNIAIQVQIIFHLFYIFELFSSSSLPYTKNSTFHKFLTNWERTYTWRARYKITDFCFSARTSTRSTAIQWSWRITFSFSCLISSTARMTARRPVMPWWPCSINTTRPQITISETQPDLVSFVILYSAHWQNNLPKFLIRSHACCHINVTLS